MTKKILLLLAVFILTCNVTFAAPQTVEKKYLDIPVVDAVKLLEENEVKSLTEKIRQTENKHQVKIGIVFMKTIGGGSVEYAANALLNQNLSDSKNGSIILLVVMDTRSWQISLDSKMETRIANAGDVSSLHGNFLPKLSNGDYYGACNSYVDTVDELLTYYEKNGTPYNSAEEFNPMALAAAVVISILIGIAFRSILIGSMSNVRHAQEATDYLKKGSVQLTGSRDTYLFTNVSRRPKSRGSNRGGGRGSGGGGSSAGGHF